MTTEEKAAAYDKAVTEIRGLLTLLKKSGAISEEGIVNKSLQGIFPELRDSDDERIRKALICGLSVGLSEHNWQGFGGATIDECLSYLERQKEQKTAWSEKDETVEMSPYEAEFYQKFCDHTPDYYTQDGWKNIKNYYAEFKEIVMRELAEQKPSWKPSEEQMEAFCSVLEHEAERVGSSMYLEKANSLYEQLKKL